MARRLRPEDFDAVDRAPDPAAFVAYLDAADRMPQIQASRDRTYQHLHLERGDTVVDVGCGLGSVSGDLAGLGVRPIGIDSSAAMVEEARRRRPDLAFRLGDVAALPLEDEVTDGYRAERLYQHLPDPTAGLTEALRVLRPEGRIVVMDQDWQACLVDSDDRRVTRLIFDAVVDSIRNGWIGRQYHRRLRDVGFADVEVDTIALTFTDLASIGPVLGDFLRIAVDAGAVSRDEASAWFADQHRRAEADQFFMSMTMFIGHGRKPTT